ncbi:MAG TPA: zinc-ribbon domain-containing protein [Gemmatimonadaceae bacterium]|nr:zinc-ribbon domain-containing protein [Gemmatimonadaceae bacterium]
MNVSCPECRSIFRVDPAKLPSTTVRARCSVCGGVITISAGSSIEDEFSSNSALVANTTRPAELDEAMAAQRANAALAAALLDTSEPAHVPKGPTPAPNAMPALVPEPNRAPPQPPMVDKSPMPKTPLASPLAAPSSPPSSIARPMLFPPRPMMPGGAPGAGPAARPIVAPRASGPTIAPAAQPNSAPPPRTSAPNVALPLPTNAATVPPQSAVPRPTAPSGSASGAPTGTRTPINPFLANDPHAKARRLARALVSDLVTYFPQKRQEGLRDGTLKQLFKDEIQKSYEEYVGQVGREFAETTPHFQDALNDLLAGGQKVF